jgi:hypothetical protein
MEVPKHWVDGGKDYARLLIAIQFARLIPDQSSPVFSKFIDIIAETTRISEIFVADQPTIFQSLPFVIIGLQTQLDALVRDVFADFPARVQYLSKQIGYIWNGFKPPVSCDVDTGFHIVIPGSPNPVPAQPNERDFLLADFQKRVSAQGQLLAVFTLFAVMLPTPLQELWDQLFVDNRVDVDLDPDIEDVFHDVSEWMDKFDTTICAIARDLGQQEEPLFRMDALLRLRDAKARLVRRSPQLEFVPVPA